VDQHGLFLVWSQWNDALAWGLSFFAYLGCSLVAQTSMLSYTYALYSISWAERLRINTYVQRLTQNLGIDNGSSHHDGNR